MSGDISETLNLVRQAKSGEPAALNLLLDRYLQRILRIVRLRLGPKLRGRLESMDIVQEVMLRALRGFEQFEARDEAAFLHWISRLVHNEIRDQADFHGAAKRDAAKEVASHNNSEENRSVLSQIPADSVYRPSFQLRLKDDVLRLEAAMDRLNETQRDVIVMRQYEGMSFREIGLEMNLSEDAARMQFSRALDKLTDLMSAS